MATPTDRRPFALFRGADAPSLSDHGSITQAGVTPVIEQGFSAMVAAGALEGSDLDVPWSGNGMSLTRLAMKSGNPLPLHTHDCDCLYYIVSGSVVIGTETLHGGDGFFVGAEVPYGYFAGPEGAVLLEFRATERFNIRFQVKTEEGWDRLVRHVADAQDRWAGESLPAVS